MKTKFMTVLLSALVVLGVLGGLSYAADAIIQGKESAYLNEPTGNINEDDILEYIKKNKVISIAVQDPGEQTIYELMDTFDYQNMNEMMRSIDIGNMNNVMEGFDYENMNRTMRSTDINNMYNMMEGINYEDMNRMMETMNMQNMSEMMNNMGQMMNGMMGEGMGNMMGR